MKIKPSHGWVPVTREELHCSRCHLWWNHIAKSPVPTVDGVIGRVSDLITIPPELKKVITAALGNAWIVKDREAARKVARSKGSLAKAVTLNGEVFLSNGAVIAGREGRGSLISRPRERKELEGVLAQVDQDIQSSGDEIKKADCAILCFTRRGSAHSTIPPAGRRKCPQTDPESTESYS